MKIFKVLAVLSLALLSSGAWAEIRVAIVDVNLAVMNSDEARLRGEKLKASVGSDENEYNALVTGYQKLEAKRQKDAAVMSQDELRKLDQQLTDKKLELNFMKQKLQQKAKDAQQELQTVMNPKLEKAMKSIIEEKKYDLILRREAAISFEKAFDLTDELTKRINAQK